MDFYAFSCPIVELIVRDVVRSAASSDPSVLGKLLMLLFHDYFVEATRELRAMEVKSIIVGITACTSEDLLEEFANCGLDCCLQKPLNSNKVDTIMQLLT